MREAEGLRLIKILMVVPSPLHEIHTGAQSEVPLV